MFVGRTRELEFLNDRYSSQNAELVVLYGRRRIGKTELLKEFCKDKPNFFYTCREYTDGVQLKSFTEKIRSYGIAAFEYTDCFSDWEKAFLSVLQVPTQKKKILVIDEFPYACKVNESIPSILQVLWDEKLQYENVMVILCGSSMSFIEKKLLAEKKPLYGRATGIYKLLPLPYTDAVKFFPNYSYEDKLTAYSILGGIPHYLKQFDPNASLKENVIKKILNKGSALYSEVEFLLRQELREPAVYNTVIEQIALGNTVFNDITTKTGIEKAKASVYLKNLIELGIVRKEVPVLNTKSKQLSASKGIYVLTDDFFRFWFAFAYHNFTDLERDDAEGVWNNEIEPNLHDFSSKMFENVCLDYLYSLNKTGNLPFRISNAGRFWGKSTKVIDGKPFSVAVEIDILATDKANNSFIMGECKFKNEKFDLSELRKLQEKFCFKGDVYYYLFALSGFTDAVVKAKEANDNITLVTPEEIFK
ncbi:MAG: ATP-binding protein [Clostridiales bacterium]|nr:ATP-binding protein [Clostridiales bacterium]